MKLSKKSLSRLLHFLNYFSAQHAQKSIRNGQKTCRIRFVERRHPEHHLSRARRTLRRRFLRLRSTSDDAEFAFFDVLSALLGCVNENYSEALQILEDIGTDDVSEEYYALAAVVHSKLNNHADALKCAEKYVSEKDLRVEFVLRMMLVKAESLFWMDENDSKRIPEILSLYKRVMEKSAELSSMLQEFCLLGVARCKFLIDGDATSLNEIEKSATESSSSSVDARLTVAWYHWKLKEFDVAQRFARVAVDDEPLNNFSKLLLGRILWASSEKTNQTMKLFVDSAKLNSNCWESFYYLALCQLEINHNDERALACLERANTLSENRNESVGVALANLYAKLKLDDKRFKLLTSAAESLSAEVGYWAWFRYEIELVKRNRNDDAVSTFQTLLRSHPTSVRCWESLADAYFARGSYSSALKTFETVLEFEPTSMYAAYRIACVMLTLNRDDDAAAAAAKFDEILTKFDPSYVPAMIGLAESLFRGSKLYFSQGRHGRAVRFMQEKWKITI